MLNPIYYFYSFHQPYYGKQKQQAAENKASNKLIQIPRSLSMRHLEAGLATLQV